MLRSRLDFEIICSLDLLVGRAKVYIFLQAEQNPGMGNMHLRQMHLCFPVPRPPNLKQLCLHLSLSSWDFCVARANADIGKPLNFEPHLGISLQLAHLPQLAAKQPLHFLQARFR